MILHGDKEGFEDQDDTGREENEPKVLPTAGCFPGYRREPLLRIEVRLLDGVMARSADAVRLIEEHVADLASVDVDNCSLYFCPIGQCTRST